MNTKHFQNFQAFVSAAVIWLRSAFDATATWVTQLSWRKFLLIAIMMIFIGALIQDILFGSKSERSVIVHKNQPGAHSKLFRSSKAHQITTDDGTTIRIDSTGLHITGSPNEKDKDAEESAEGPAMPAVPAIPAVPPVAAVSPVSPTPATGAASGAAGSSAMPVVPPAPKNKAAADLHIYLRRRPRK
jgi:hypothetical protein